jgi:hypothetical protein
MLCKMKIGTNLYKGKLGEWRVRFEAADFKNQNGAASDSDYDVVCPKWLGSIIDFYLANRHLFPGGGTTDGLLDCPYFIRPAVNNGAREQDILPIDKNTLFQWCKSATFRFIPDCIGFGPHAWRHIVATDWIKNNPNGFQVAAKFLHDKLETVMSNYQHLKTSDWLLSYNTYSDSQFEFDQSH